MANLELQKKYLNQVLEFDYDYEPDELFDKAGCKTLEELKNLYGLFLLSDYGNSISCIDKDDFFFVTDSNIDYSVEVICHNVSCMTMDFVKEKLKDKLTPDELEKLDEDFWNEFR